MYHLPPQGGFKEERMVWAHGTNKSQGNTFVLTPPHSKERNPETVSGHDICYTWNLHTLSMLYYIKYISMILSLIIINCTCQLHVCLCSL